MKLGVAPPPQAPPWATNGAHSLRPAPDEVTFRHQRPDGQSASRIHEPAADKTRIIGLPAAEKHDAGPSQFVPSVKRWQNLLGEVTGTVVSPQSDG